MKARVLAAPAIVHFGIKFNDSFGNGYGVSPGDFAHAADANFQGNGYVARADAPMPYAGIIRNLRIQVSINTLNANTELEIFKNGSATGVKITITSATTGAFSDLTNTVEVAAGDKIMIGTNMLTASSGSYSYTGCFEVYKP